MTELPDSGNDSSSNKNEDQSNQSLETAAAALASIGATQGPTTESSATDNNTSLEAPASGKRDHNGTSVGIMGGNHSAKRGKREWLSFRGARHTRVGEDYQVASLPPVGGVTNNVETPDNNEEGN